MNRLPRICVISRQISSFKIPSLDEARATTTRLSSAINLDEHMSKANDLKDGALDISLDQYVKFINKTSSKLKDVQIPAGKKLTITTNFNLGMMGITTVIEDKN